MGRKVYVTLVVRVVIQVTLGAYFVIVLIILSTKYRLIDMKRTSSKSFGCKDKKNRAIRGHEPY